MRVLKQGRFYSCTYQCKQGFLISSFSNTLLYKKECSYRRNRQLLVHLHINCENSVCQLGSDTLFLGITWQRKWSARANKLQRNIERQILSTVSALFNRVENAKHSHAPTSSIPISHRHFLICLRNIDSNTTHLVKLQKVRSLRWTRVPAHSSVYCPPPFFSPDTFSMPSWNSMRTSSGVRPGASGKGFGVVQI